MFKRITEQDYYQVLEIAYGATPDQIQSAYDRAREIYQSDSLVSASLLTQEERQRIFHRIAEAYHILIAEESRRLYDQSLAESSGELREILSPRLSRHTAAKPVPPPAPVQSFPRLVKPPPAARKSNVTLGIKEEASGEFLRRARESAGLDLRTIAAETKIGVTMLAYIEAERLDRLPAPVYLRNFVSQYARCLGLEEERVARSYLARVRRLQSKG